MMMIDPPEGYRYGFPKAYFPRTGETIDDYLLANGYPETEIAKWPGGVPARIWNSSSQAVSKRLRDRCRLSGPAVRTFVNIASEWQLDEAQCGDLLDLRLSELRSVIGRALRHDSMAISTRRLMRLSAILNIYGSLQTLFVNDADRIAWLNSENDLHPFGGRSPIVAMTQKDPRGLFDVLAYVQAKCAGN